MELSKTQRNDLFKTVRLAGVNPADCILESRSDLGKSVLYSFVQHHAFIARLRTIITHYPSGSCFSFRGPSSTGEFVVGSRRRDPVEWPGVVKAVREWADDIVQPDLWDDLVKNEKLRTGAQYDDLENSPFSENEQEEISDQLREIKKNLKEAYSLSNEQMYRIEARLDEAEKASRRMGRKD